MTHVASPAAPNPPIRATTGQTEHHPTSPAIHDRAVPDHAKHNQAMPAMRCRDFPCRNRTCLTKTRLPCRTQTCRTLTRHTQRIHAEPCLPCPTRTQHNGPCLALSELAHAPQWPLSELQLVHAVLAVALRAPLADARAEAAEVDAVDDLLEAVLAALVVLELEWNLPLEELAAASARAY